MVASADKVPIILNQQYLSDDINVLQDIWGRWVNDCVGYGNAKVDLSLNTATPAFTVLTDVVLGGLEVVPDGTGIKLKKGGLTHKELSSPSDNEPISGMLLGFNIADTHYAVPTTGSDTWYLVEAAIASVDDTTVSVPIWNGSAFISTPGQVKRTRQELTVLVQPGTATSIPALDTNFVPIAAVFKPAGGGATTNAQIVDLRPLPQRVNGAPYDLLRNRWATNSMVNTSTTVAVQSHALCKQGELSFGPLPGSSPTSFDPTGASFIEPSTSPSANEWWYLYLCPLIMSGKPAIRPRHLYASHANEGILVFTNKGPAAPGRRTNGSAINLPAPFADFTCPVNEGVLIGTLQRNAGNTGWTPMACNGDRVQTGDVNTLNSGGATLSLFTALGGTNDLPAGAVAFDARLHCLTAGSGPVLAALQSTGGGATQKYRTPFLADTVNAHVDFFDADLTLGQSYELAYSSAVGGTCQVDLLGFRF